jgi:ketosteroid isomerase-like protein
MSEENVGIVRKGFDALATGGVEAVLDFAAPDGVWYTAPEWLEGSEYHGHDDLRFLFSVFTDSFDGWSVDVIELRDAGDAVVALIEHGGKIKGTNVPIRQQMGVVASDFRHGQRVGRFNFFETWREALEAAGLSE